MIDDSPIGAALSRSLGSPTAPGEKVEAEWDAFIAERHRKRVTAEGERAEEAAWQQSVRRYNARRREENRLAWCEYFGRLASGLRSRADEYDHRARVLMEATDERKTA